MDIRFSKKLSLTLVALTVLAAFLLIPSVTAKGTNGPYFDKLEYVTIKSPDLQVKAMKLREIDMYPGLIRPGDVEELKGAGKKVIYQAGGHFCYFTFNMREYSDGYGQDPHSWSKYCLRDPWFRLAVTYLTPKDILIGTIFKYIVIRIDTPMPVQLGKWYNPNVPTYEFDPDKGVQTLLDHGYKLEGGVWKYGPTHKPPEHPVPYSLDGTPLGDMVFLSPSFEEAPTSYTITKSTVAELHKVGLTNINHLGMTFTDMLNKHVYPPNFDLYFLCWTGLGPDPDHMWAFFHSSQMGYRGRNRPGTNDPELDALALTVHESLDEEEVRVACWEMQMRLMDPNYWYGMCYIPIYSRNFFDAYQPELSGQVNPPLIGTDCFWTDMNMRWDAGYGHGGADGPNTLVYVLGTELASLNLMTSNSADETEVWGGVFDGLMDYNPYTLDDMYGQANYRHFVRYIGSSPFGYVDGMKFTFTLRDDIYWHTGVQATTEDIKFAFDTFAGFQPALWISVWEDYVGTEIINTYTCDIYYNKTSLWLKGTVAGAALLLPKHIWQGITDWEHFYLWNEVYDSDPVTPGIQGVQIPDAPAGHYVKKLCGTGPWIFDYTDPGEMYTALYPNPNYYRTKTEIEDRLLDTFYLYGDIVNEVAPLNQWIDATDLLEVGLGWVAKYPEERYMLHEDADIAPSPNWPDPTHQNDEIINVRDAILVGLGWQDFREH